MSALHHEVPTPPSREEVTKAWRDEGRPKKFTMNKGGALYFTVMYEGGQFYVSHSICLDIFSFTKGM